MNRAAALIMLLSLAAPPAATAAAEDPLATAMALPKPATAATKAANAAVLQQLPFQNRQDFADAQRGLIATLDPTVVKGAAGRTAWNLDAYTRFVNLSTPAPDTVNPSLSTPGSTS